MLERFFTQICKIHQREKEFKKSSADDVLYSTLDFIQEDRKEFIFSLKRKKCLRISANDLAFTLRMDSRNLLEKGFSNTWTRNTGNCIILCQVSLNQTPTSAKQREAIP